MTTRTQNVRSELVSSHLTHSCIFIWCKKCTHFMCMTFTLIFAPGSRSGSNMVGGLRNYFRMVSEHKDIVRSVMALQGMMYMFKPDLEKLMKVTRLIICILVYSEFILFLRIPMCRFLGKIFLWNVAKK